MNYQEALQYVHSICWRGSRPGLSRITELMHLLQDPQETLSCIHVTGTNGKGSTCAMLASVLQSAGYRVGLFTSPYIRFFNERIQIDRTPIPEDRFAEITSVVQPIAEQMADPPTEFELITAIGFLYFAQEHCDYVILEAGMGGRLDSTNLITRPLLSVITGVAMDHTAFLGDTLAAIAFEKAGILKPHCPAVFGGGAAEAEAVILQAAKEKSVPLQITDRSGLQNLHTDLNGAHFDFPPYRDLHLPLLGTYQPENAATALTAIEVLQKNGVLISEAAVRTGFAQVKWPARFEKLREDPLIFFDGGHNEQGISACIDSIRRYFPNQKLLALTGVMQDKAYTVMAEKIASVADCIYTVTPQNPRSLDAAAYARVFADLGVSAQACPSVQEGVALACRAAVEQQRPLIILGSLYLYEEVSETLETLLPLYKK